MLCVNSGMRYRRDVVRQVLDILEEGPQPLRDAKRAEKVKTGAELFEDGNQGYVVSDSSVDLVKRVREHNSTYPKMADELDKRRSTSKATVLAGYKGVYTSNSKSRPKPRKPSRAKWERPRRNARRNKRRRGVDKNARNRQAARFGSKSKKEFAICACMWDVGCQCSRSKAARSRRSGTDDILTFELSIPKSKDFSPMDVFIRSRSVVEPRSSEHGGSIKSLYRKSVEDGSANNSQCGVASVDNPETSDQSISSYNSFVSVGQEPMV